MALDAVAVRAVADELRSAAINGRIEKIHQPERDEITIGIRTFSDTYKLVLSAASSNPRIHFSKVSKTNPKTAPMFCMLLRKHLGSGKITDIRQYGFERIIEITAESYDELGELTEKRLIIEIMGKHSNIILVNHENKIIDSIKHVDRTVSSVRQVLPGMTYSYPPAQNKTPLTEFDESTAFDLTQGGMQLQKSVIASVSGISPLTAREAVFEAYGASDYRAEEISDTAPLYGALCRLRDTVAAGNFRPCLIKEHDTGRILEFSAVDIKQYGSYADVIYYDSVSELLDAFYSGRDAAERMKQRSADLFKLLSTNSDRAAKKLIVLQNTVKQAQRKEEFKEYADLIMANLWRIEDGAASAEVENYYADGLPTVKIPLDPSLSASDNAQRYYKKYRKSKTAEIEAAIQLEETEREIDYLDSTLFAVESAASNADLSAIRDELAEQGYIKRRSSVKKKTSEASKPLHFISSDGFDIYTGRNNTQNDWLTLKFANTSDIWFHTKNIHGSHTIIKLGTDKEVPERTMLEAAQIAAYYSKGRSSSQVPVDYTQIKNVKKPNGAKPGMVIYDRYNTVYVTPQRPENSEI